METSMARAVTKSKDVPNGTDVGDQLAAGIREQAKVEGLTQGDVDAVPNGTLFTDDPEAFEDYLSKAGMDAMAEREGGYECPTGEQLAAVFNKHMRKTVDSILIQAIAVSRSGLLVYEEEEKFHINVGFAKDSGTCRKWTLIGNNITRLRPFMDRLPPNWTTIYKLVSLEPEEFRKVTDDPKFNRRMTGNEIGEILGTAKMKEKLEKFDVDISINLDRVKFHKDPDASKKVFARLRALQIEFGFESVVASKWRPMAVLSLDDFAEDGGFASPATIMSKGGK
jgi:hypothetical protein